VADEVSQSERRFEILATVLLALAAVATAWSGYQASLWDGIQSSDYSKAAALRTESAQQHTEANEDRLADLTVFENFIDATIDGDTELAAFYRDRASGEFESALEAWLELDPLNNPDAPPSPFALPEYQLEAERESTRLAAEADATFASGEDANNVSDAYVATTLFFAAALFFSAVSERFEYRPARLTVAQPVTSG
jgi:hypothetical protein